MNNQTIKIISGSVREGRFSQKAAEWLATEFNKQAGVSAEVIDLKDYPMPFFDAAVTPSMKTEPYTNEAVARFTAKIAEADAIVMVTPEYNHSTSGVLKNAIDWVSQEWNRKPVAFMSYGSVSGARAVEHLRQIMIELQMAPIRSAIQIPGSAFFPVVMGKASAEDLFASLDAAPMISDLLWWSTTLANARANS